MEAFQEKEKQLANVVKIGRTELQDAVLMTLGREMSAYAEAFARDRWRIYKCEERLRVVNLGGTAIGTGLGAPRQYIFRATEHLRQITGLGLGPGRKPRRGHAERRRLRRSQRHPPHVGRQSAEDRQRSAAAFLRPACRLGRNPLAAPPGGLVDHAGQSSIR